MTNKILAACLAAAIAFPAVTLAQQAAPTVTAEPGKGMKATQTVEGKATVMAIDYAKRTATLKNDKGEVFDIVATPEMKRFDEVKVGDVVAVTYTASVAARIALPGEEAAPGVSESVSAPQGAANERKVTHDVTAKLKVEAVDTKMNTVTLSDAAGNKRVVDVVDPRVQERLKTVKVGDIVVVTYSESLALRLERVAK